MKYKNLALVISLIALLTACTGSNVNNATGEYKTVEYIEPIDSAESATLNISIPFEYAHIRPLVADSANLLEATIEYVGHTTYETSGETEKTITLSEDTQSLNYTGSEQLDWDILANPNIPTVWSLTLSSGRLDADLRELKLTGFDLTVSSGHAEINFPVSDAPVPVELGASSGVIIVTVPDAANFDLRQVTNSSGDITLNIGNGNTFTAEITTSSGSVAVDVPDDAALQINVTSNSSGELIVPATYTKISGDPNDKTGIWASANFEEADAPIILNVSISSGTVSVK